MVGNIREFGNAALTSSRKIVKLILVTTCKATGFYFDVRSVKIVDLLFVTKQVY